MRRGIQACIGLLIAISGLGCGSKSTPDDRTITFSGDGESVAFQHGDEGVFVRSEDGTGLEKIYEPGEGVFASSAPEWSPTDRRLIFTTAKATESESTPTTYTCWLRDEPIDGVEQEPQAIFETTLPDPDYVRVNLAARWSPDGKQVWHIRRRNDEELGVYAFDLKTKKTKRIAAFETHALIFDWSPDGKYLTCMFTGQTEAGMETSIWVREWKGKKWWRLPIWLQNHYGLDSLRGCRPVWDSRATQFAFVKEERTPDNERVTNIRLANLPDHSITTIATTKQRVRDIKWSPDGSSVGFLETSRTGGVLQIASRLDESQEFVLASPNPPQNVRTFAGWDTTGKNTVLVSPEASNPHAARWALMFRLVPGARDRVLLANSQGQSAVTIFDGMNVTFPNWAPDDRKLSVWFTFQPSHETWLQALTRLGLQSGDPAAVLNVDSKQIEWLAVSGEEKVQIGHYYAIQREFSLAWKWYEEAANELPPATNPSPREFSENLVPATNFEAFKFHCLKQLGRNDEASRHLESFRQNFLPVRSESKEKGDEEKGDEESLEATVENAISSFVTEAAMSSEGSGIAIRDLYLAQVLLSVGGIQDAIAFFETPSNPSESQAEELSRHIMVAQLYLLNDDKVAYARYCSQHLIPKVLQLPDGSGLTPHNVFGRGIASDSSDLLATHGAMTLLPTCSTEFLGWIPDDTLRDLTATWEELEIDSSESTQQLWVDLFLRVAYARQNRMEDLANVERRILEAGLVGDTIESGIDESRQFWDFSSSRRNGMRRGR